MASRCIVGLMNRTPRSDLVPEPDEGESHLSRGRSLSSTQGEGLVIGWIELTDES